MSHFLMKSVVRYPLSLKVTLMLSKMYGILNAPIYVITAFDPVNH